MPPLPYAARRIVSPSQLSVTVPSKQFVRSRRPRERGENLFGRVTVRVARPYRNHCPVGRKRLCKLQRHRRFRPVVADLQHVDVVAARLPDNAGRGVAREEKGPCPHVKFENDRPVVEVGIRRLEWRKNRRRKSPRRKQTISLHPPRGRGYPFRRSRRAALQRWRYSTSHAASKSRQYRSFSTRAIPPMWSSWGCVAMT